MIDWFRTLSAKIVTRFDIVPRALRVRAWAWLAADTDDLAKKSRCLEMILELDPGVGWARAALGDVRERQRRLN